MSAMGGEGEWEAVGVDTVKDKEVQFEDFAAPHTLDGASETI